VVVAVHAPSSIFVRALSPVIIQAQPGRFAQVSQAIAQRALTRVLNFGPLGNYRPFQSVMLSAARAFPAFNMHAAVLDAVTLTQLAQDSTNVAAIFSDRLLGISQYPSVPASGTYAVQVPSPTTFAPSTLYYTSTDQVRALLGADQANAAGYSGQGVNACVVDTGGHLHPQTARARFLSVIPGNVVDPVSHGLWCLTALGGIRWRDDVFTREAGTPVFCQGMAPSANLLAIKALDFVTGSAPTSFLLAGLAAALQAKADVVSLSWGGPVSGTSPLADPLYPALSVLDAAGILIFAAAGNNGPGAGTLDSPGALPQPVTVGAYNAVGNNFSPMFGTAGQPAAFSSRGPTPWATTKPDLMAPGAIIDSGVNPISEMAASYTYRVHNAQAIAGTSMATPIAAGLFTCARQLYRQKLNFVLTNAEVKRMMVAMGGTPNSVSGSGVPTWNLISQWVQTQYGVTP
jgi:subtilisin family serine protease